MRSTGPHNLWELNPGSYALPGTLYITTKGDLLNETETHVLEEHTSIPEKSLTKVPHPVLTLSASIPRTLVHNQAGHIKALALLFHSSFSITPRVFGTPGALGPCGPTPPHEAGCLSSCFVSVVLRFSIASSRPSSCPFGLLLRDLFLACITKRVSVLSKQTGRFA